MRREDRWVTERSGSLAAIAPPGHPRRSTLQPRRADLHHGYELVRARGGYITERGREGSRMEKGGQKSARVPLACRVPPPKQLAGGSSDTHNNHNNGIPRVTRGPPPRIGTALRTAHVTPTNGSQHWLAARRERSHGGLPSLGSTAGPLRSQTADRQDSGPSFRAELRPRNVHTTLPPTRGQRGSDCPAIVRPIHRSSFTGSPIDFKDPSIESPPSVASIRNGSWCE